MNIVTDYWRKPIPTNKFDWSAVDDDTYDGEGCPVGYGATEAEAIADLMEQMDPAPCKNKSRFCGTRGECLKCTAEAGEVCGRPLDEALAMLRAPRAKRQRKSRPHAR